VRDLQAIAERLKLKGVSGLKKDELVATLSRATGIEQAIFPS